MHWGHTRGVRSINNPRCYKRRCNADTDAYADPYFMFFTSEASELARSSPRGSSSGVQPGAAASASAASASAASASAAPARAASASQAAFKARPGQRERQEGSVPPKPSATTALSQSIMDAKASAPPIGDQWLYRVLTATETPDKLRQVPGRFSEQNPETFRTELVRAVAPTLVLLLLVGNVYRRYHEVFISHTCFIGIEIGIGIGISIVFGLGVSSVSVSHRYRRRYRYLIGIGIGVGISSVPVSVSVSVSVFHP